MPETQTPKTYVLVGDDHNGAFKDANAEYAKHPENFVIVRAEPGKSIEESLKEAEQKYGNPSNVIVDCHGGEDGTFTWNKDQGVSYSELFSHLPQGTQSVTLGSCYGGSAERDDILKSAPEGTVVQSMVGPKSVGDSNFLTAFAKSGAKGNSTDLFVESLAVFKPEEYRTAYEQYNKENKTHFDTNPEHALPHILGIGGHPPQQIDLEGTTRNITHRSDVMQSATFNSAVADVKKKFNAANPDAHEGVHIDAVVKKLREGKMPEGADEKRIAYAITAEYLDKSGEMEQMKYKATHHGQEPPQESLQQDQPQQTPHPQPGQESKQQHTPKPQEPAPHLQDDHTRLQRINTPHFEGMPDLSSIQQEVRVNHGLVKEKHQTTSETQALEQFAKTMRIQGVRTDAAELSDEEIKKIQRALHVKDDGLVGNKTLTAMEHAEEVKALPTPDMGHAASRAQER